MPSVRLTADRCNNVRSYAEFCSNFEGQEKMGGEKGETTGVDAAAVLERAQLLSIYFAMRGVPKLPAHVARCEEQLRRELDLGGGAVTSLPRRGHLQRVK